MALNSKSLATDAGFLFASTLIVNAGNYAINLLLGRWLGPADFSEVSLIVTLLLIISFFALAFQLTAAKFTATYESLTPAKSSYPLLSFLNQKAVRGGLGLAIGFIAVLSLSQNYFHLASIVPYIIFGVSMPFYLLMSVNRGVLQGKLSYKSLALTYQSEMWVRLAFTLLLVYLGLRVNGVAVALLLSLIATWYVSKHFTKMTPDTETIDEKTVMAFFKVVLVYECSQILINNSDIVLVKHFFEPTDAGLYAALALVGRIVYFGTWTIVTLLFPMVIKLEKEGKNTLPLFFGGLGIVMAIAAIITAVCYFFPDLVMNTLFGAQYLSVAPLLWKYAVATSLFAGSNVFVYYHMSLDRHLPIYLSIGFGILQIIFLYIYHASFEQVIMVQIALMAALMTLMVLYQLFYKRLKI
ncbi:oligosaccharide flippase family protein [Lacihabitans lacunae]|uniref:Oligosaccharide flippase family protein n=1 Tax=Lacihabitans lacunae TaxID=1028214 RepID=A0ABV7YWK6_9BACT